jgi:hypothetical protein
MFTHPSARAFGTADVIRPAIGGTSIACHAAVACRAVAIAVVAVRRGDGYLTPRLVRLDNAILVARKPTLAGPGLRPRAVARHAAPVAAHFLLPRPQLGDKSDARAAGDGLDVVILRRAAAADATACRRREGRCVCARARVCVGACAYVCMCARVCVCVCVCDACVRVCVRACGGAMSDRGHIMNCKAPAKQQPQKRALRFTLPCGTGRRRRPLG